jgi:ferritin-like metal-binding protein YciE
MRSDFSRSHSRLRLQLLPQAGVEDKAVLDAAIVANAQAVEHYEMCRYGTLIAWAEELGHDEIVRLLTTNLNEEKSANTKLNTVALRKGVNAKASTAA